MKIKMDSNQRIMIYSSHVDLWVALAFFGLFAFAGGGCKQVKPQSLEVEAGSKRPNVLFIAVDDLNDWTGFLGGNPQVRTPNIDRLAHSGVAFTHAYPSAPVCGPSRTSLLYGLYPWKTGAYGNNRFYSPYMLHHKARATTIPNLWHNRKSLPTVFRENGYYTAGAGKLSHFTQTPRFHSDVASYFKDDFDTYYDSPTARVRPEPDNPESSMAYLASGPAAPEDVGRMHDTQYAGWAIKKLQKDYNKPFFLAVGFRKPHMPWVAPQPYFNQYDLSTIKVPEVPDDDLKDIPRAGKIFAQSLFFYWTMYPESDHQVITKKHLWKDKVRAYLAAISYADAMVGKVLDALASSPYADNTIVVLWGDHGWHLGEKKHWRKMTLWETGTRTPLIIRLPAGNASNGRTVEPPVSLQDIFPTLVDLLNLKTDQPLDGHSLVPLLEDPGHAWTKPAIMGHGPGNFAVRTTRWRYIRYQNGDQELYDEQTDPHEWDNLATTGGHQQLIKRLGQYIPKNFITLYDPQSLQFANMDTMKIFTK